ncbi:MAG: hypothetical protein KF893_01565 [Caldilineaceae bacterium]|nr:hypothetical protein [Caldilineaceae bacterium]
MKWFRRIALGLVLLLVAAVVLVLLISRGEPLAWYIDRQITGIGQAHAAMAWNNADSLVKQPLNFMPFREALEALGNTRLHEIEEAIAGKTVPELQDLMAAGKLTTEELLLTYLTRIERYDLDRLNSVLSLSTQALAEARALDAARAAGDADGLLHGIPVLIKDNIAVAGMPTTGGSVVLASVVSDQDAFMVRRLREAGALILGKANLSEWGYFMSEEAPAGYSALGGHTRNPYGRFDVGGSSSGSAAALAANLVTVAVGSETMGSLTQPAGQNAIFALKPSLGLVSGTGTIPLLPSQDTAGPMARTVTDLAFLFTGLAAADPSVPVSAEVAHVAEEDFTTYLQADGLSGVRIGVMAALIPVSARSLVAAAVQTLEEAGATVVEVKYEASLLDIYQSSLAQQALMAAGMQRALPAYLATLGEQPPVSSVAEIVAFNVEDPTVRARYGQGLLEFVVANDLSDTDYEAQVAELSSRKREAIRATLAADNLDFLLSVNALFSPEYAPAGFPALAIPVGFLESGEPLAITLVGDFLSDGPLIAAAYAFEQMVPPRTPPDLDGWGQ